MWGALSDEKTGLSFTIAADLSQRSHSRVRVPWELATIFYCLILETSLFIASYESQGNGGGIQHRLHTGKRVKVKVRLTLRLAVYRQSVCLGVKPLETHDQRFFPPTEPLLY
jgi:hypothetical protein